MCATSSNALHIYHSTTATRNHYFTEVVLINSRFIERRQKLRPCSTKVDNVPARKVVVQLEELIYNLSEVTEKNHGNPGIIRTGFGVELAPGPAEYNERGMGGGAVC